MNLPLPNATSKCYDNTRISTYKTCPRSYFIRHVLGWRPEGTGIPLVFGLSWHDGQDEVWEYAKEDSPAQLADRAFEKWKETWSDWGLSPSMSLHDAEYYAPRTPGTAREMYHHYVSERWRMLQESEVIAIEQPFAVPMPDMDNHWYIGRLDKTVDYNAQLLILEHKTTTAYATSGMFRSDYIDSWFSSSQVKGYQFGGGLYYPGLQGVWVDAALVHKKIHNAFRFIPVSHNFTLLEEWIGGTKQWVADISAEEEAYKEAGELKPGMFKKNEESCFGKYGSCPFLDICRTTPDPSKCEEPPPGFVHEPWEPFSILGLDKLVQEAKL